MQKNKNSMIPTPLKVILSILGIVLFFIGFFGFFMSAARGMHQQMGIFNTQKPLNDINGIAVASNGDIYIGEMQSACIQVYNQSGVFQYGFYFSTGGAGWFALGIDSDDKIHVVTARNSSHYIFKKGELVGEEKNIDYDMQIILECLYDMTDGSMFQNGEKSYRATANGWVKVTDLVNGSVSDLNLHTPKWPLSVSNYWFIAGIGALMLFFGIAEVLFPGIFPERNTNKNKRFRFALSEKFNIITSYSLDETHSILSSVTQSRQPSSFENRSNQRAFVGRITCNYFEISPTFKN